MPGWSIGSMVFVAVIQNFFPCANPSLSIGTERLDNDVASACGIAARSFSFLRFYRRPAGSFGIIKNFLRCFYTCDSRFGTRRPLFGFGQRGRAEVAPYNLPFIGPVRCLCRGKQKINLRACVCAIFIAARVPSRPELKFLRQMQQDFSQCSFTSCQCRSIDPISICHKL